jgi:hypothetical protein
MFIHYYFFGQTTIDQLRNLLLFATKSTPFCCKGTLFLVRDMRYLLEDTPFFEGDSGLKLDRTRNSGVCGLQTPGTRGGARKGAALEYAKLVKTGALSRRPHFGY